MFRYVLLLILALPLTACAVPIPASEMLANPNIYLQLDHGKLTNAVDVGAISIGPHAPTAGLVVTKEEFANALRQSLSGADWYAASKPSKYTLEANFIGFDQPFTVFNTKIFSEVNYTLKKKKTDDVVYQQNVKIPCIKGMGEIWNGDARQIETMKCSIRENVTHVLRDLNSKF